VNDPPVVWIVDAEQWPRALLRAELIERGYEAIGFVTLPHAVAALAVGPPGYPRPRAVVVDLGGQAATAAALGRLAASGAALIAVGGAVQLAAPAAAAFPWAATLQRPATLGEIADALGRCVPAARRA
jgi:hypothetical protein